MAEQRSPGWYPAPDGSGEQWWNGAGWSESRRNADGTTPGLPGYQATPPPSAPWVSAPPAPAPPAAPAPLGAPNPYAPPAPQAARPAGTRVASNPGVVGLIFGALSLVVFPLLGVVAIVLGIVALRRPAASGSPRIMAIVAIVLGCLGILGGFVQLVFFFAD